MLLLLYVIKIKSEVITDRLSLLMSPTPPELQRGVFYAASCCITRLAYCRNKADYHYIWFFVHSIFLHAIEAANGPLKVRGK
jgi:hypothetical protein